MTAKKLIGNRTLRHALVSLICVLLVGLPMADVSAIPGLRGPTLSVGACTSPGQTVDLLGTKFSANTQVTLTWDDAQVGTVQSDDGGVFRARFTIPPGTMPGVHQLDAKAGGDRTAAGICVSSVDQQPSATATSSPAPTNPPTNTPAPNISPRRTPTTTPTSTPSDPPAAEGLLVYGDALAPGWQDYSWSGTVDFAAKDRVQTGSKAIAFTLTAGWGAFSAGLTSGTLDTSPFSNVRFYVNGGANGGQSFQFLLHYPGGTDWGTSVLLTDYIPGGVLPANEWRLIDIPLSALAAANTTIDRLAFQDTTGHPQSTIYIDGIEFYQKDGTTPPATTTPSPEPTSVPPTPTPTTAPDQGNAGSAFPLGVFEDAGMIGSNQAAFEAMINDIKGRGLDSVMITNGSAPQDAPMLDVSDRLGANVYIGPFDELWRQWWPSSVPADEQIARQVISPLVDQFKTHPSLKAYYIIDEPDSEMADKVAIAAKVFRDLDPPRGNFPLLIGFDRIDEIVPTAQPNPMVIDAYPFASDAAIGDTAMRGFGYNMDFTDYIRRAVSAKPANVPLWIVLQTHSFGNVGDPYSLRAPTPAEVRLENWLAIGEGAQGIFWFIYSSQQGWQGLADNPALYNEVTALAQRTVPLRSTLLGLHKVADQFSVTGNYTSTLSDGNNYYAVVVNRDCQNQQQLRVNLGTLKGKLRDLESGNVYAAGDPIPFAPGDGKIFALVSDSAGGSTPVPTATPTRPAATPTPTSVPVNPSEGTFVTGINFGGNAVTIDGHPWLSWDEAKAEGVTTTAGQTWSGDTGPINPAVDGDGVHMLQTLIWNNEANFSVSTPVPNGDYNVYLWLMENYESGFRDMNVKMEGASAASAIGDLPLNTWAKYGPYAATVRDGRLDVDIVKASKGDPILMGMAVFTKGSVLLPTPSSTPTAPAPAPTPTPPAPTATVAPPSSSEAGVPILNLDHGQDVETF
ncbi:MAG: hypothetical protein M0Z94_11740, partial [Dehalococcoidales bacterium]|nr:hypothetical protein [Dehalococcoidales bacterium]